MAPGHLEEKAWAGGGKGEQILNVPLGTMLGYCQKV